MHKYSPNSQSNCGLLPFQSELRRDLFDQFHAAVEIGVDAEDEGAVGDLLHELRHRDLVGREEDGGGDADGGAVGGEGGGGVVSTLFHAPESEMLDLNVGAAFSDEDLSCHNAAATVDSVVSTTTSAAEVDSSTWTPEKSVSTLNFSILDKYVIEIEDDFSIGGSNLQLFPIAESPAPPLVREKYWLNLLVPEDFASNLVIWIESARRHCCCFHQTFVSFLAASHP